MFNLKVWYFSCINKLLNSHPICLPLICIFQTIITKINWFVSISVYYILRITEGIEVIAYRFIFIVSS